LIKFYLVVLKI